MYNKQIPAISTKGKDILVQYNDSNPLTWDYDIHTLKTFCIPWRLLTEIYADNISYFP